MMPKNNFSSSFPSRDLSIQGGELGPTLKLKRFFFYQKYERAIDRMYYNDSNI